MNFEGQLIRCPHCLAPLPGQALDPGENICPKCGKKFDAAEVIIEDYPKRRRKKR